MPCRREYRRITAVSIRLLRAMERICRSVGGDVPGCCCSCCATAFLTSTTVSAYAAPEMGVPATTAAGLLRGMAGTVGVGGTVGTARPAVGDGAGALNAVPLESLTQAESVMAAPTRAAAARARDARTRETLGIAGRTSSGATGGAALRPTGPQYTGCARSPQCPTRAGGPAALSGRLGRAQNLLDGAGH